MAELMESERALLTLERQWWRSGPDKRVVIRDLCGMSPAVYAVRLRRLVERPEALAYDPLLVKRLRRKWQISSDRVASLSSG